MNFQHLCHRHNSISSLPISPPCLSHMLSHLILISLALNFVPTGTLHFTNQTDKQALLAIKDKILEDPFKVLSSWNDSIHFCDWQGVTCSRRHPRVTVLSLPSLKLVGSISPHIGNLSFIRAIHLHNNSFHGTIPQDVGRLFRLQNLTLSNNSFQGEFPINLTHCQDIKAIHISYNHLIGKIPKELGLLSNLQKLDLSKNHFTGKIPASLGNLSTTLHSLRLSSNSLEGTIPLELGQLSKLVSLQMGDNNLSGRVPTQFYNFSSLNYFSLAANHLYGTLPTDLGFTLPNLKVLYFGENHFSGAIPPTLANASGLLRFNVVSNSFTGPVPLNLGSLPYLEWLDLSNNPMGSNENNDLSFFNSLTNCTNLKSLHLEGDNFQGALPSSIANLSTQLHTLELDKNHIYGSIPQGIGNLINLQLLTLDENMLTGTIPESIGKLSRLQELYLYRNNISGKIPSSVGNISQLGVLSMGRNMISGSIPVSLANCKFLQALDLSYNLLTGAIPEQVIGLSSLSNGLGLRSNYLTGALPALVGNLKNAQQLDVAHNRLSGEIPSTLGDCQVLEYLSMEGNSFEGTIPLTLNKLKGIQALDLSINKLSGKIPNFLGNLPFLKFLNLSYNMFEGEVPNKGVFVNASSLSIEGNSKLCGGIEALHLPACPIKRKKGHSARRVVISIPLCIFLLVASVFAILCLRKRSNKKALSDGSNALGRDQYPTLSYAELLEATDGFSSANLIGEGRYGSVYKGILRSTEQVVAVKVLKLQECGAGKSFLAECKALRNIRHRNLVKVITACSSTDFSGNDFKALVFEFMQNGSLDGWLHPTFSEQDDQNSSVLQNSKRLNIMQRLNIAINVATALDYLHHLVGTPIIHCDLKPGNVLLDNDLCAHVGDFGLARFLISMGSNSNQTLASSSIGVRGTVGYVAPEYGMGTEVSIEADVYSYGILLLEMFTGKRPTDSMFADSFSLRSYVELALPEGVMEIVDSLLTIEEEDTFRMAGHRNFGGTKDCLVSVLRIGLKCSAELPRDRMDIKDVALELHCIRDEFVRNKRESVRERERRVRS